jgi:hypothetical protein
MDDKDKYETKMRSSGHLVSRDKLRAVSIRTAAIVHSCGTLTEGLASIQV